MLYEIGVQFAGVCGYFFPKVQGYSPTRQLDGAIRYANFMGDVARSYNMTMMMEPMAEPGSLWPTYREGLAFVRRVDHPNVKIMADLNYFLKLSQPFEDIKDAPELSKLALDEALGTTLEVNHVSIDQAMAGHLARVSTLPADLPRGERP